MLEFDAAKTYETLLRVLREVGLAWVVEQVQEQVRSGKPVTRLVTEYRETISNPTFFGDEIDEPSSKRRRQRLAATEPFSANERLDLAIRAIEISVLEASAIETSLTTFLQTDAEGLSEIRFQPDEFDEAESLSVERPSKNRATAIERLEAILARLREENQRVDNS